ncbi:hypothetical protein [Endozoicomonas arenosclerae]|uniref:hypothetical protein n=1 Tax=Endozoicomonas arenosclerae TaxID=1633495 RepID=UPI0007864989|nr:hypothetical protein [Endozoicomonas arenosclerae]
MIYSLRPDVKNFLWFNIDSKESRRALGDDTLFHMDESPISYLECWQTMEIEFYSSSAGKVSDLPDISQRYGRLFINQKGHAALLPLIDSCGEFLPVTYNKEHGYIFNVLTLADDALDLNLCKKNEWGEIDWIAFNEQKLQGFPLFRVEFDNYMGVFCNEQFKQVCEDTGLQGLRFSHDLSGAP